MPSMMRFGTFDTSWSKAKVASSDSADSDFTASDFALPSAMSAGLSSFGAFAIWEEKDF